jgi:hypothetical protein
MSETTLDLIRFIGIPLLAFVLAFHLGRAARKHH